MSDVITLNASDMAEVRQMAATIGAGAKDAIRFATNDSLSALRTESARLIAQRITAGVTRIRNAFTVKRMYISDMTADITCRGEPMPLSYFSVSQVMRGVNAQVFRPGTRKLIPHAFIRTMSSGHRGVFWRIDRLGGTGKWPVGRRRVLPSPSMGSALREYQLPMKELYGPRVPDIFDDDNIMNPVLENASSRFDDRLEYHTQRLLDRAAAA